MGIPIRTIARMTRASLASRYLDHNRPLNIMLAVTDRCTGSCNYCGIPDRKSPEMTTQETLTLVDEAADLGCQRLGIWGGEPLLRKDLDQIIGRAKQRGLWVTVDSNGHLLPERGHMLEGINHLSISLDGDRAAHDANRGKGAFDRTLRGLVHAQGRFDFWTLTVLTKNNMGQVDWILDLARRLGFATNFQVLHHNDQLGCNDGLYPEEYEVRQVAQQLLARKKEGAPIVSSFQYLEHLRDWPDYSKTRLAHYKNYPECLAGKLYCNVDVNGKLYPCSLFVDEIDAPDVRDNGLAAAFEALESVPCRACVAACFTEYNHLYRLDWRTGTNWVRALLR